VHATASEYGADGTAEFQIGEEHDLRSFKKMLLGMVACMAIVAGVAASPASATVPTKGLDTQEANVPYLAWRGEHVRLGFCDYDFAIPTDSGVSWALEDWSGDPANGSVPVPQELFGQRHFYNGCVYTDFTSQKAGVAFIKLVVSGENGVNNYEKQFMVAWMDLSTPAVTGGGPVNAGDCNVRQAETASLLSVVDPYRVCDPAADNTHLVTANVKGNIPLKANFSEWGLGDHLTMPDDWGRWAAVAARSWADHLQSDWITNWDIHDDLLNTEGHVNTAQCDGAANAAGSTDAVDNCTLTTNAVADFGNTHGWFSTVFGVPTRDGYSDGPFDPLYPHDTMLSDGKVDAGDAPMPAAQIDVTIAENSGGPTDISGVGYLVPSYKSDTYSRDGVGTDAGHNYFAPFYHQYIPATGRPVDPAGSAPYGGAGGAQPTGIDGSGDPDGFNGFWFNGLYENWQFAYETSYHPNTLSSCLDYRSIPRDELHNRPLPYGVSAVTVYTDEHGEAQVNYVPGLGFYFDNLGAIKNVDGGCDIENIDPIGTADLTVQARYPYQPVTAADPSAAVAPFVVHSLFHKTLAAYAKGPGAENANVRVVLAHAQDIDGSPLAHEIVCWSEQGAGYIHLYPTSQAGGTILDQNGAEVAHIDSWQAKQGYFVDPYSGRQCTTTDEHGNTAVEVGNSEGGSVDVMTEWMNEIIFRDIPINFNAAAPGSLSDTGPITHVPTPTQIKASLAATGGVVGPVLVDGKAVKTKVIKSSKNATKKVLHKIRTARVVKPFHGKRVLQVRVNGKSGMVALKITIKLGKTTHVYKRFVLANKKVAVKNLPIPAKTAKVTVSLIG
jgi:hypothetical protein